MLSIEYPQPRSQEPFHSFTLNAFTDRPSEPLPLPAGTHNMSYDQHSAVITVMKCVYDEYYQMLQRQSLTDIQAECAVVSSQSTPLGRCGSLTPFTVTAKYDCHRNWDAASHIFNLHGRAGSGDVEQREQYRHGPISAAILHLSTPPTPHKNVLVTSYPQPGHQRKLDSRYQTHTYGL